MIFIMDIYLDRKRSFFVRLQQTADILVTGLQGVAFLR